ncbi:hypothetical protein BH09BAC5_BH09BAC5_24690 [soil metagenome]
MKKLVLFSLVVLSPLLGKSQYNWDFGGGLGAANILGDMGGKELTRRDFVSDLKFQETRMAANGFARYKLSRNFSIKGGINYACLRGADSLSTNPARHYRNLSFKNNTFEASATCQFFFYEVNDLGHTYRYKDNFRAYIGLGLGGLYHNPKALYNGSWVALRPLMTENHKYTKVTMTIPAEIGFYFTLNKHYRIGWNLCWRTTFSDYLDDVSSNYADPATLSSPLAVALADRTNHVAANAYEHGYGNNFGYAQSIVDGNPHFNKRGDPTHNDSYITSNFEFSYVMRGKSSLYKSHYGNLFKGSKSKHRKVRAKF